MTTQLSMLVLPASSSIKRVRVWGMWVTRKGRTLLALTYDTFDGWRCPFCPGGNIIWADSKRCARCGARVKR